MNLKKIHPAFWIVLFFAVLFVLEGSFFLIAGAQPDDRIDVSSHGRAG